MDFLIMENLLIVFPAMKNVFLAKIRNNAIRAKEAPEILY
jgi:hypothetical protein